MQVIQNYLYICAHGHTRLVCVALCLSRHEESFVYLQYIDAFFASLPLFGVKQFERNRERPRERGRVGGKNGEGRQVVGAF